MKERERKFNMEYQVVCKAWMEGKLRGIQHIPQVYSKHHCYSFVGLVLKFVVLFDCLVRIVCLIGSSESGNQSLVQVRQARTTELHPHPDFFIFKTISLCSPSLPGVLDPPDSAS